MAQSNAGKTPNQKIDFGEVLASWEFPEYTKYFRGKLWYAVAITIVCALTIYAVSTQNYLFLLLLVILVGVYALEYRRSPRRLQAQLTEDGLVLGESTFYEWNAIKQFWIVYDPPEVKNLYFSFKSGVRPSISIALESQNPLKIRQILLKYIEEDPEKVNESFSDGLGRVMKL
ncbi:MAG: hypothetical protein WC505_04685 [Patescibacteria group bacterium]